MERHIRPIYLLIVAAFLFVSCVDDDKTEVTLYDDVAITDFEITSGTVSGTSSVTLSQYQFNIDHRRGEIFNTDSLPLGTDASSLLCSYSTRNNGLVYIEDQISGEWSLLTSTEAVNFSGTRYLHVVASDNATERTYKVTVNIHKQDGDGFNWACVSDDGGCTEIKELANMKAFTVGNRLIVFGQKNGSTVMCSTDITDGKTWTTAAVTFGADAYRNTAVQGETIYVLDGKALMRSDNDGQTFTAISWNYTPADANGTTLSQLIGASTTELYALTTDGKIAVSTDGGTEWTDEIGLSEDATRIPVRDITFCSAPFKYNDNTDYVVMAGNRSLTDYAEDANAMVWRKIVEYSDNSRAGSWTYINVDDTNVNPLPRLSGLTIFEYDSNIIALGGAGIGACDKAAYSQLYESRDGGITWKQNTSYAMPEEFDVNATSVAATADSNNYMWIVCSGTGQVWRGRLNRLGWNN